MSQDKLLSSLSNFNLKYVYIVDDKTNNNVFTLMKKKESDTSDYSVSIPIKYRKYISKLLNLTNSKKDYTSKRILKIKPLGVVFSHRLDNSNTMNIEDGISFITNKENNDDPYNKKKSYFDELTFGEDRGKEGLKKNQKTFKLSFNAEIAAKQLRDNISLIREDINIDAETKIWVIARCDDALETKLYFTQLDADKEIQPQSLSPQSVELLNDSTAPPTLSPSQASSLVSIPSAPQAVASFDDSTVLTKEDIQRRKPLPPPPIPSSSQSSPVPTTSSSAPPPPPMPSQSNVSAPQPVTPKPKSAQPVPQSLNKVKKDVNIETKYSRNDSELTNINTYIQSFIESVENKRTYDNELMKNLNTTENISNRSNLINILNNIVKNNPKGHYLTIGFINKKIKILEKEEKEEKSSAEPTVFQDINEKSKTQEPLSISKLNALVTRLNRWAPGDEDWDEYPTSNARGSDVLSKELGSDKLITSEKDLIEYLQKIIKLNCNSASKNNSCDQIKAFIDGFGAFEGGKKYYNKYSKYKQKYLEAKKLEKEEKSSTEAPVSQDIKKEEESKTQKPLTDEQLRALARLLIIRPILEEDWDEYPTSNAEGSDFLSKDLGSVKRITSEADLIEYLQEIIKLNCNSASKNNSCDQIKAFIETLGAFEGGKKYYNKYSKYKQKYLEAKKLHGDELHGDELHGDKLHGNELHGKEIQYGGGKCTIILCPQPVWEVLNDLYKERKFNDIEFFIFIMGPRSFLTDEKTRKLCSCWDVCIDNYWDGGLGLVPGKYFNTFDIATAKKQINTKLSDGVIKINGIKYSGYKYFYFNSSFFSSGYEITF